MQVTVTFEDGFREKSAADQAVEIAKRITLAADEAAQKTAGMLVEQMGYRMGDAAKHLREAAAELRNADDARTIASKDSYISTARQLVQCALSVVTAKQHIAVGRGILVANEAEATR